MPSLSLRGSLCPQRPIRDIWDTYLELNLNVQTSSSRSPQETARLHTRDTAHRGAQPGFMSQSFIAFKTSHSQAPLSYKAFQALGIGIGTDFGPTAADQVQGKPIKQKRSAPPERQQCLFKRWALESLCFWFSISVSDSRTIYLFTHLFRPRLQLPST